MSLYQLDESTKSLLTLDNFLEDMSVSEFVDKLSKQNVEQKSTFNNGVEYLDPKPYIRTFELVQKNLDGLTKQCLDKKTRVEKVADTESTKHYNNVLELNGKASELNRRYQKLTGSVSRLYGTRISPLGDRLTAANSMKEHSVDLIYLTKCYNTLYTKEKVPEELRKYKPQEMERVAKVLGQLMLLSSKLAGDDSLPNLAKADKLVTDYATQFETDQLENFNKYYYKQKDLPKSQQIARVLFTLNGGAHIVESFVDSHPIFSKLRSEHQAAVDEAYWENLGDPDNADFALDEPTSELLSSVSENFAAEIDSITEIFQGNSKAVLESLIFKLYGEIIGGRVNYLMKMASSNSKLASVRVLHLVATETYRLTLNKMNTSLEEHDLDLSSQLEKAYADIFSPYLKDDAQFNVEKANLIETLDSLTSKVEQDSEKAVKKQVLLEKINGYKEQGEEKPAAGAAAESPTKSPLKTGFFSRASQKTSRLRHVHFSNIGGFLKSSERNSASWRDRLKRSKIVSGHLSFGNENKAVPVAAPVSPLVVTEKLLNYVAESLNRSIELVPGKINEYSMDLFEIMMFKIGPCFILAELEALYFDHVFTPFQKLNSFFSSSSPVDLSFLPTFIEVCNELYILSLVVKKSFYPLLLTSSVKSRQVNIFNSFMQDMEIGLNITLTDTLDLLRAYMQKVLDSQSDDDFSLRAQTNMLGGVDKTVTCDKLTLFLDYVLKEIHISMESNPDLEYEIVRRLAYTLLELLIGHFKKFTVTSSGSIVLTQDVIHYISVFQQYDWQGEGDDIKENFQVLKELANLSSCQPELLKDLCNEGKLTYLKKSVLREYIRRRIDFREGYLDGI